MLDTPSAAVLPSISPQPATARDNRVGMTAFPVYRPSGRVGPRAWALFGLVGDPAALVFGWGYANAVALVSWKPAVILVALVLWAALAVLVSALASRSRSRSPAFNRWAGAAIGFIALWAHWVVLLKISEGSATAALFAQSGPLGWLAVLARFGSEQNAGEGIDWVAAVGWSLEAAVTIGMTASVGAGEARMPYSEARGEWAAALFKGELVAPGASSESFSMSLQDRGTRELLTMLAASSVVSESVAAQWWTVEVEGVSVTDDPQARWLNVTLLVQTRNDHGRVEVARTPVVRAWQVDAESFDAVRRHLSPADVTAVAVETPPVLQPAVAALERGDFASAFAMAEVFVDDAEPQLRADASRLCALSASRTERWSVAFRHFEVLFGLEPTAFNALQLATTSVRSGELERGLAWLQEAHETNDRSRDMLPPRIDTAFLSALEQQGEYASALPLLGKLAGAYQTLPTLDDHFVWSHGLPFFSEFLRKSLPLLQHALPPDGVLDWYARLGSGLGAEGVEMLDAHLAEWRISPAPKPH